MGRGLGSQNHLHWVLCEWSVHFRALKFQSIPTRPPHGVALSMVGLFFRNILLAPNHTVKNRAAP